MAGQRSQPDGWFNADAGDDGWPRQQSMGWQMVEGRRKKQQGQQGRQRQHKPIPGSSADVHDLRQITFRPVPTCQATRCAVHLLRQDGTHQAAVPPQGQGMLSVRHQRAPAHRMPQMEASSTECSSGRHCSSIHQHRAEASVAMHAVQSVHGRLSETVRELQGEKAHGKSDYDGSFHSEKGPCRCNAAMVPARWKPSCTAKASGPGHGEEDHCIEGENCGPRTSRAEKQGGPRLPPKSESSAPGPRKKTIGLHRDQGSILDRGGAEGTRRRSTKVECSSKKGSRRRSSRSRTI